jgi:hypothetical protein
MAHTPYRLPEVHIENLSLAALEGTAGRQPRAGRKAGGLIRCRVFLFLVPVFTFLRSYSRYHAKIEIRS